VRKFVKGEKITFPVPIHTAKILKQGTLKGISRKADISIDHLNKLLKK
jgi:predicted RNA binding protein YcfA (HicA-like mRNA interferase family)